jgi:O-methyltransferase
MTQSIDHPDSLAYRVKRIVKSAVRSAGFEVRRTKELSSRAGDIRHSQVLPEATYSPWLSDDEFNRLFQVIKDRTLVDVYRCYELWQLVAETAEMKTGDVLEVGVWNGGTGALIAKQCQLVGIPDAVYLCDTFRGVVKAGPLDSAYVGGEHADATKEAVVELCKGLGLGQVHVLEGIFPDDSGNLLTDRRFRFCHIDVDVYESARDIAKWIWPRLVPGGMIVYDDYGFHSCSGITKFVNEERGKAGRLVIHNLNGHGIVIKLDEGVV